jgi:hypothetical protein
MKLSADVASRSLFQTKGTAPSLILRLEGTILDDEGEAHRILRGPGELKRTRLIGKHDDASLLLNDAKGQFTAFAAIC